MLDETRAGFLRIARLVRIDRDTGVAAVVGSYPRLGLYDTHYLLEDRDGRPLVAASSRLLGLHVLVGLSAGGSISSFGLGQHPLASAPIVDDEAYTFLLRTKSTAPVVRRLAHLPMLPGRASEAKQCF